MTARQPLYWAIQRALRRGVAVAGLTVLLAAWLALPAVAQVRPPGEIPVTAAVELRAPPGRDEIAAQIGAVGSIAEARDLLAPVPELRAGTLQGRIQPAIDGERIYYRALVAGFSSRAQAARFCSDTIRGGGACFVR